VEADARKQVIQMLATLWRESFMAWV